MYRTRETNPHFLTLQPRDQPQPPESVTNPHFIPSQPLQHKPQLHPSQPNPSFELPIQPQTRPLPVPSTELPPQTQPRPHRQSKRSRRQHGPGLLSDPRRSELGPDHSPTHSQPHRQRHPRDTELLVAASPTQPQQTPVRSGHPAAHQQHQPSGHRIPPPRKTKPLTWFIAVLCAIFWIVIILVGLIVLIVYLVYHPKSPKFDVAVASLNAVYLDMGYLLNADLTLLANFTNPNKKVNVNFKHIVINLYFDGVPIATRYIDHFHVRKAQYSVRNVHMLTSQVGLSKVHLEKLKKQIESGRVKFYIEGLFKAKSRLGNIFKYSYQLYGHCSIVMTSPPGGVLIAKTCRTKR